MSSINPLKRAIEYDTNQEDDSSLFDSSFLNSLNQSVWHIKTNISSQSLSYILSRAKVVLLSDIHNRVEFQKTHGFVINALWQPGSKILTEERDVLTKYVKDEYKASEIVWDLNSEKDLINLSLEESGELILSAADILQTYLFLEEQSVKQKVDSDKKNLGKEFDTLNKQIIEWRNSYFTIWKKRLLTCDNGESFYKRNESLIKNILEQVKHVPANVFVIAGRGHLEYEGSHYSEKTKMEKDKAVDLIFKTLDKEKISYVHFCPRSHPFVKSGQIPDKWAPRSLDRHKNKLIPLDQLNVLSDTKPLSLTIAEYVRSFQEADEILSDNIEKDMASSSDLLTTLAAAHLMLKRIQQEIEKVYDFGIEK